MTHEEYYQDALPKLRQVESILKEAAYNYTAPKTLDGVEPILYVTSRIKKPQSMIAKLEKHGLTTDSKTALEHMHDAVGVRIICSFHDDVYAISNYLKKQEIYRIIEIKDYIRHPKSNGYRSLHLIVEMTDSTCRGLRAEIQLRTIATDFWAALEHQIKYKKKVIYERTMQKELKRCADEIASVDLSMQTLRDILNKETFDV